MTSQINRDVLERPFAPDHIKSRKGAFGRELNYIEGHHYIKRLNEAFDGEWSWQVLHHEVHEGEVVVIGVLEARGIRKHAFGGSSVTKNVSTGQIVSLADDFKSAATDALKKACSLLGVGLDLYEESQSSLAKSSPAESSHRAVPGTRAGNAPRASTSNDSAREPERQRLTVRQLRALYAISHGKGMSDRSLKTMCVERFGAAPEFLSRHQASDLLGELGAA